MPIGNLSKKQLIAPAITAVVVLMMAPAMLSTVYAQNPHFIGEPECTVNERTGDLSCSGRVAGLGDAEEIEGFLSASVVAEFGCDNPGRGGDGIQIPPGQPTETDTVSGDAETLDVRNGQVRFNLDIAAPEPDEDFCKPGWTPVLTNIEWTDVQLNLEGFAPLEIPGTFPEE